MGETFQRFTLNESWRQFEPLSLAFGDRATIVTGTNGSGKTALLQLLSAVVIQTPTRVAENRDASIRDLSVPVFEDTSGFTTYRVPIVRKKEDAWGRSRRIGEIAFSSGHTSGIYVPLGLSQAAYEVNLQKLPKLIGVVAPSHRRRFSYHGVDKVSFRQSTDTFAERVQRPLLDGNEPAGSVEWLKQVLPTWAIYSYGSSDGPRAEFADLLEVFLERVRQFLPVELGFEGLVFRPPEIVMRTRSGEFMLDASSGGVASLIELLWALFAVSPRSDADLTLVIDEPENHLHPAIQRQLLPRLLDTFPKLRIIAATHSPLVVGSVRDARVYALRHNERRRVEAIELDLATRAGTANEILREVLGVSAPIPIWVESVLTEIIDREVDAGVEPETLERVRRELEAHGLGDYVPEALADLLRRTRRPA